MYRHIRGTLKPVLTYIVGLPCIGPTTLQLIPVSLYIDKSGDESNEWSAIGTPMALAVAYHLQITRFIVLLTSKTLGSPHL